MIKLFQSKQKEQVTPEKWSEPKLPLSCEDLWRYLRYFSIGSKISFYPSFDPCVITESVVIGYNINNHLIYSMNDIQMSDAKANSIALHTHNATMQAIEKIEQFYFILPNNKWSEPEYQKRYAQSRGRLLERTTYDFQSNDRVTLISSNHKDCAPHLEALVSRTTKLTTGYYANHEVAVLGPKPATFQHVNLRIYQRLYTRLPAQLQLTKEETVWDCVLVDFCEESARIEIDKNSPLLEAIHGGHKITIRFTPPNEEKNFVLVGTVKKIKRCGIIITLTGILRGKNFDGLELLDVVEIKSKLLNNLSEKI